jgi:hypothetical protein
MRFINLTRKIARWTCSSVRGSNEPSKPIRIKKIHSHLIMDVIGYNEYPQRTETNITFDKNIPACFQL